MSAATRMPATLRAKDRTADVLIVGAGAMGLAADVEERSWGRMNRYGRR